MTDRATEDLFNQLHGLQAQAMIDELRRCVESGEGIPPALFTSINKYLKDNGIDRPATNTGDAVDLLNDELDSIEFADNVIQFEEQNG